MAWKERTGRILLPFALLFGSRCAEVEGVTQQPPKPPIVSPEEEWQKWNLEEKAVVTFSRKDAPEEERRIKILAPPGTKITINPSYTAFIEQILIIREQTTNFATLPDNLVIALSNSPFSLCPVPTPALGSTCPDKKIATIPLQKNLNAPPLPGLTPKDNLNIAIFAETCNLLLFSGPPAVPREFSNAPWMKTKDYGVFCDSLGIGAAYAVKRTPYEEYTESLKTIHYQSPFSNETYQFILLDKDSYEFLCTVLGDQPPVTIQTNP